ncbi:hypothetical protein [Cohnella sp. AR92]|uniref:hypothetical protein n=1 Tax=Cohnella sp. AR92 TaxID=648716 RepID=UPI000F8D6BBB|nr:hypothetical protein [Cohnella sp. AR92]RUS47310.1 hypothetical protein ELR57_09275 [Cohnella sp. AR92]
MGKRRFNKGVASAVIASLLLGLAPGAVWAEAANEAGSALAKGWDAIAASLKQEQQQEQWKDGEDLTETPQYYQFTGDQVLEEHPEKPDDRMGGGGAYLKMGDTAAYFPSSAGSMTLS